jgi:transposase
MAQRKYDQKLIDEAIDVVVNHGRSVVQAARDFGIAENTLYAKVARYKRQNDLTVIPKQNETLEQEVVRLRKELAQVKMDREILKKATAYFASLER